jgi:hypothetical protein
MTMALDSISPSAEQLRTDVEQTGTGAGGSRQKEYDEAPYVVAVRANVATRVWPGVLYSWMSLRGHLQAVHHHETSYMFARGTDDHVLAMFFVVFTHAEGLSAWLEGGYGVDTMLTDLGVPASDVDVQVMRDFS